MPEDGQEEANSRFLQVCKRVTKKKKNRIHRKLGKGVALGRTA